jgi:mRNA interferase YafQ
MIKTKHETKRIIQQSAKYRKEYRNAERQGKDMSKIIKVIKMLANDIKLPKRYKDHAMKGKWKGYRDCHIEGDWVLIYRKIDDDVLELLLSRLGSHSELGI